MELGPERGLDAVAGLVVGIEVIPKRLDDVIGRDANMCRTGFEELQHGAEHAAHCGVGRVLPLRAATDAVEVAKQLVGAVDEMDDHGAQI